MTGSRMARKIDPATPSMANRWRIPIVAFAVASSAIAAAQPPAGATSNEAEPEFRVELPEPPATKAADADVARGAALYAAHCASCHGDGAVSGSEYSDLRYTPTAVHRSWNAIVVEGIYATAGMPAFKGKLSGAEAESIRSFVIQEARTAYETCTTIDRNAEPTRHRNLCTRALND